MKYLYRITLFLALFFVSLGVYAQSFNGGLLAGGVISQVDGDHYSGYHHLGFTAGAYVNLPFSDNFSLQTELKYSLFGSHSSVDEVEAGQNPYSLNLHYVEMPVMARYNLGLLNINGKHLDFLALEAGLSFDFLMNNSESANNEPALYTNRWNFFSMTANVGVHFDLNERWGVGIRYMYSFWPIRVRVDNTQSGLVTHFKNNVLQAVITYNIKARGR